MNNSMRIPIDPLKKVTHGVLDILLPPSCNLCGGNLDRVGGKLCAGCLDVLWRTVPGQVCRRCAMPREGKKLTPTIQGPQKTEGSGFATKPDVIQRCYHCRSLSFSFCRAIALGLYQGDLRNAVIASKQSAHSGLLIALGELLATHITQQFSEKKPDLVIGVPSHWTRRVQRGGTSAQLLADSVASSLSVQTSKCLRCVRRTRKQGTLSVKQRAKNVFGAFAVVTGYVFPAIRSVGVAGNDVLLVDDVLTTGATGNAAAAALLDAGAASVSLAVLARATGYTSDA